VRSVGDSLGLPCHEEDEEGFDTRRRTADPWNTVDLSAAPCRAEDLPMVDHFVLRLFPMGHIKSTMAGDEEFVKAFDPSPKWLRFTA